ncbi:hypothetical protein CRG98_033438 [Punica granatum]|uniref:Uncharacterized protein n=1 Tax=Punica granatum TaxID=22663 RepID=A0A2I0IR85_PUNGR|nr:hypothetical protein CRG98_033438 [Punica granatum]
MAELKLRRSIGHLPLGRIEVIEGDNDPSRERAPTTPIGGRAPTIPIVPVANTNVLGATFTFNPSTSAQFKLICVATSSPLARYHCRLAVYCSDGQVGGGFNIDTEQFRPCLVIRTGL